MATSLSRDRFAEIVTTYDAHLCRAPLSTITEAIDRLDRYHAAETNHRTAASVSERVVQVRQNPAIAAQRKR